MTIAGFCHGAPLAGTASSCHTRGIANPLMGGAGNNSYDYWLDQTSRLYYRSISPAQYRESLNAFFGAGNDRTIDCLVANLPR